MRTRILVMHDTDVLVVKQWLGNGRWSMLGGGLHKNETAPKGALRELKEETGIELQPQQLQFIDLKHHNSNGFTFSYSLFIAELAEKPPVHMQRRELVAAAWVARRNLTAQNAAPDLVNSLEVWTSTQSLVK